MSDAERGRGVRPRTDTDTQTTDADPDDQPGDETPGTGLANVTLQPGRRTTSSKELLKIEAELAAEGKEIDNPAVPTPPKYSREGFVADAIEFLEDHGLEPAWRVCSEEDTA